jgi:hypothetical protein
MAAWARARFRDRDAKERVDPKIFVIFATQGFRRIFDTADARERKCLI